MALPDDRSLTVTVSFSPRAGEVDESVVRLALGATVADAVQASGLRGRHPAVAGGRGSGPLPIGVWGVRCAESRPLRDGDRVELYRSLTVDPKEARRQRHRATADARRAARAPALPQTAPAAENAQADDDQAKPSR